MSINKQIANAIKKSLLKLDFSKLDERCTNEAQTRFILIEPILEILGYSRIDDMATEINAGWGKKNDKADIGLIIKGKVPEIIIECKKYGKKLTDKEVEQTQGNARSLEKLVQSKYGHAADFENEYERNET